MGGITYEKIVGVIVIYLRINGLRFASAYAATTYGPTDTVTAATSKKAVKIDNPSLSISTLSVYGSGYYTFWIRYNTNNKQVSPTYQFNSTGSKTIYYMTESRTKGYVVKNGMYDARFRSNDTVPINVAGTITVSFSA